MTAPGSRTAPADPQAPGYPPARRDDLAEDLHGQRVPDPYRWLEDAASADTREWLAVQDTLWAAAEAGLPGRSRLAARLQELMAAGYVGAPAWRGPRQFFMRRQPGQEHGALLTAAPGEPERVLIDPAALDPAGLTTLDSWQPDQEGRLLAYQLSSGGDEESELRVLDVVSGAQVDGPLSRCRYSPVAWLPGGQAFYYVRKLPPDQVPPGEEQFHRRVYLHTVGTPAEQDVLVFGAGRDKTNYYDVSVSRDGRWLVISAAQGTAPRNDVWLADLTGSGPAVPPLQVVQEGVDARTGMHVGRDGRLYVFTDAGAPRGRLAVSDPAHPEPARWRDLVGPDPTAVLTDFAILDGAGLDRPVLVVSWTRLAISEITVHDLVTGEQTGTLALPGTGHAGGAARLGTTGGISARPEGGHEAWFGYTDSTTPAAVYHYDARTGEVSRWAQAPGAVGVPDVRTRQVTFTSKDGTEVAMLVVGGGDQTAASRPAQPRPAILYGYGGFGISMVPAYSASILAWVEAGGVYAIAALRGGGEEGEDWHRAGMREHKQAVFDDFHAAAEALIAGGWTTPGQLGISGGSNGGLLVGAALTQRPDLYRAVVCSAPLLDMVRYERFGLGQTWNDEYGTAEDPVELGWLLGYSPYHRVRPGTRYPATLFTVFDNDTRVDPVHAWKMCAALQHATSAPWSERPVLLRREREVGHGARAVSRSVTLSADTLAFLAAQTGLRL
ncbi:MAG TPA: prolyl oligopeptidase family serine peptidase [Streptosporangiaceae bacterium]|nr:prolyl oligopeptidase family serine peptidase [Streptosporangiaceae bacterium]